jgi:hypothetical protein
VVVGLGVLVRFAALSMTAAGVLVAVSTVLVVIADVVQHRPSVG